MRVPAVMPWADNSSGTLRMWERSRSIFWWLTNVPPPRPITRRTAPACSIIARACRSDDRLTPSSIARLRSDPSRSPACQRPASIWVRSSRWIESARGPVEGGMLVISGHRVQRLGQDLAAVHRDRLAGDVRRLVGGKEQADVADVVDRAELAGRDRGGHRVLVLLAQLDQALGEDVARQDGVD